MQIACFWCWWICTLAVYVASDRLIQASRRPSCWSPLNTSFVFVYVKPFAALRSTIRVFLRSTKGVCAGWGPKTPELAGKPCPVPCTNQTGLLWIAMVCTRDMVCLEALEVIVSGQSDAEKNRKNNCFSSLSGSPLLHKLLDSSRLLSPLVDSRSQEICSCI